MAAEHLELFLLSLHLKSLAVNFLQHQGICSIGHKGVRHKGVGAVNFPLKGL